MLDPEHGNLMADLDEPGKELVVAMGGKGGKGNTRFATSIQQTPRKATKGGVGRAPGQTRAEAVCPGGSACSRTLASRRSLRVTAACRRSPTIRSPRWCPRWASRNCPDYESLIIADLPGLIEGAARGIGLGHRFLKHVERCKVLLHLVDVSAMAERDPVEAWRALEHELEKASPDLHSRPRLVVATKYFEDDESEPLIEALRTAAEAAGQRVPPVSSVLGLSQRGTARGPGTGLRRFQPRLRG
ncbi:MAG: GTPase [Planctomycetota bacterium]